MAHRRRDEICLSTTPVFDGVVCSEVLEHLDDDLAAMHELGRVLKPGGALAVTVPCLNYPGLWDPLNRVRESLGLGHFSSGQRVLGGTFGLFIIRLYTLEELEGRRDSQRGVRDRCRRGTDSILLTV